MSLPSTLCMIDECLKIYVKDRQTDRNSSLSGVELFLSLFSNVVPECCQENCVDLLKLVN